jgi:hypothetical protein
MDTIKNNPVASAAAGATITSAIILLLARRGIILTNEEAKTFGEVVALLLPFAAALWARTKVVGPLTFKEETGKDVSDI